MKCYSGLLIASGFSLDFLLLVVLTVGPLAGGRGRPTGLDPTPDAPHGSDEVEAARVLATMTPAEADTLEGKRSRFLVVLDGSATMHGKYTLYEVVVPGANDLGTVWLAPGQDSEDGMLVEARLVVLHRKAWTAPSGERIPEFTEYRLTDAVRR